MSETSNIVSPEALERARERQKARPLRKDSNIVERFRELHAASRRERALLGTR